ncbi:hypothetical protein [Halocalculus aciditolerans]|uniref:Uncharacterized protein n=1 Tax=Halocalculus aciditolerans TaxID=1383812 RepID=A0A830FAE5_9EURY|nr:hypothetical protein [Halocalculus aciditolerans]GGL70210.1 hypothetical protein GCM10009039_30320 [Halocalculus aciditolerans]
MSDEHRDVHVHADLNAVEHKLAANLPADEVAFWTVNGMPRQTGAGARIVFSTNDRVVAEGEIVDVVDGRIWFDGLEETDGEVIPAIQPPTRGFKYGPAVQEGSP